MAQAFETHALTDPELSERLRQSYSELLALLTALGSDRAAEHLALALGLAGLTLTGNLTAAEARAAVRSGIKKRG
ncbi:hypothetical protein C8D88_111169 [Lentzea atacamensis]|uniref:Uncharacterized protein n=1 Tax=Lentzea atacamensis TaxID=531938 RepID=A0A316HYE1_9PSEU|nr:hypothetical protein [Lentzea atacamensis]PWK83284.1 hypothetical protein C8D88_111169 [Lentzea atacamensis]